MFSFRWYFCILPVISKINNAKNIYIVPEFVQNEALLFVYLLWYIFSSCGQLPKIFNKGNYCFVCIGLFNIYVLLIQQQKCISKSSKFVHQELHRLLELERLVQAASVRDFEPKTKSYKKVFEFNHFVVRTSLLIDIQKILELRPEYVV